MIQQAIEQLETASTDLSTDVERIDGYCRQFDRAWRDRAADRPAIATYLKTVEPQLRGAVLRELVAIDWERRVVAGETPDIATYRREFADLSDQLDAAFLDRLMEENSPSTAAGQPESVPDQLGEFRILHEIGRGGMGVVYAARQESLDRMVAIKVLPRTGIGNETLLGRFQREAQANARLRHPHIVPVFGVGQHKGIHFFVMDLIDGVSLSRMALRGRPENDSRDWSTASEGHPTAPESLATIQDFQAACRNQLIARIGRQIADALEYAHEQGVVHRDVKPANLMLDTDNHVWLTDFGLAGHIDGDSDLTETGALPGTIRYMPPEAFGGQHDARGDVYGLGVTLYELLTLRPAFDADSRQKLMQQVLDGDPPRPRQHNANIPRDLETIILKAIAHQPQRRYATAGELADDLQRFLEDRPIRARRVSPPERVWRWARRRPVHAALAACITAAVVLAVMAGFWIQGERAARSQLVTSQIFDLWEEADRAHVAGSAGIRDTNPDTSRLPASSATPAANTDHPPANRGVAALERAVDFARRAAQLAEDHSLDFALRQRADDRLQKLQAELDRGRILFDELDQIRLQSQRPHAIGGVFRVDSMKVLPQYRDVFARMNLSPASLSPQEAASRIWQLEPVFRHEVLIALNHWYQNAHLKPEVSWLADVLERSDDDPWCRQLRAAWKSGDNDRIRRVALRMDVLRQDSRLIGDLCIRLRDYDLSIQWINAIRRARPTDFWANHTAALIALGESAVNPQGAVQAASIAEAIRSTPSTQQNLAFALMADGQHKKAESLFRSVLRSRPDDPFVLDALAQLLFGRGEIEAACELMAEATRHAVPRYAPRIRERLGECLRACGRTDEAKAVFRQAIEHLDDFRSGVAPLSRLLVAEDRADEAIALLREALTTDDKRLSALARLPLEQALYEAYGQAGRVAQQQALKPHLIATLLRRARQARRNPDLERELFERVLQLNPAHREALQAVQRQKKRTRHVSGSTR